MGGKEFVPHAHDCIGRFFKIDVFGGRCLRNNTSSCLKCLLIAFRHGLRASELCGLQWSDVEFEAATLHLRRAKGGSVTTHPLLGDELRSLRTLKREAKSPFIFVSERGAPFSTAGLAKLIERAGIEAKLPFKCHPHMLRHSTGYALANKGTDTRTLQAYLSHRSIQSTVRYTELAPGRFKNLWR